MFFSLYILVILVIIITVFNLFIVQLTSISTCIYRVYLYISSHAVLMPQSKLECFHDYTSSAFTQMNGTGHTGREYRNVHFCFRMR